jgi:hypothetical protein
LEVIMMINPETFTPERALDVGEKIAELLEGEGLKVAEAYAVIALLLAIMGKSEGRPIEHTVETLRGAHKVIGAMHGLKNKKGH